jgi:hypothetical protein
MATGMYLSLCEGCLLRETIPRREQAVFTAGRARTPVLRCNCNDRSGSKPESIFDARMSAFTSCGQTVAYALARCVPILLQKSFSTVIKIFSSPLMRFSDKYVTVVSY